MADAFLEYLAEIEKNGGEAREAVQKTEKVEKSLPEPEISPNENKTSQNKRVCKLALKARQPEPTKKENSPLESKEAPLIEIVEKSKNLEAKKEVQPSQIVPLEKKSSDEVQELLKKAETHFPEEWIAKYELAHRSKKTDYATQKIREGKFRLNKEKKLEILSEFDIYGKSSLEVLSQNYDSKE